jgi:homoserine kinase
MALSVSSSVVRCAPAACAHGHARRAPRAAPPRAAVAPRAAAAPRAPRAPAPPARRGAALLARAAPAASSPPLSALLSSEPAAVLTTATAFAPATVANLGPGFDYLGVAVEGQGDVVTATLRRDLPGGSVEISSMTGDNGRLSLVAADNCCGIAAAATLRLLGVTSVGVSLACRKGLPLGSGLGSSAASAAAAAWAVNLLFGAPLTKAQLVAAGLESEAAVSGYHADNIAPAIMGGFVLVRSYSPTLQLLPLRYGGAPANLWFCLVTPVFEAPTREMRAALPKEISMKTHVANCAAGAGLVAGILGGDAAMLGAALGDDTIVEPARGPLIPGFAAVKAAAMAAGAFGCTISGAGPTVVAIAPDAAAGQRIAKAMADAFTSVGKLGVAYAAVAQLCAEGAQQCEPDNTGAGATDGRVIRIV